MTWRPAVVVEVADPGTGESASRQPRILDPFFATKAEGKRTGLGPAICKRTVDQHHGRLGLMSPVGTGAAFRVVLRVGMAHGFDGSLSG